MVVEGYSIIYLYLHLLFLPPTPSAGFSSMPMAESETQNQSQWDSLPEHLLEAITARVISLRDLFRFSCVCNSWRSACPSVVRSMNTIPWLIVPYEGYTSKTDTSIYGDTLGFYTPFYGDDDDFKAREKVYKVDLPEIADRRVCGSSEGWLITVHEKSEIQLLNPISGAVVNLPPLTNFPEFIRTEETEERGLLYFVNECYHNSGTVICEHESDHFREFYIEKVVTSTSRASTTNSAVHMGMPTVVMAIHASDNKLAYYRPGIDDERWSYPQGRHLGPYHDLVFYEGDFYGVTHAGHVVVIKGLNGASPFIEIVKQEPEYEYYGDLFYLVESSSDLLIVLRRITGWGEDVPYRTEGFKVLKLVLSGPKSSWVEVTSLPGRALFVGQNNSFSCSAFDFCGCRENCIYFTDNSTFSYHPFGGHDMGVFNLKDGTFDTVYAAASESQLVMPPPIWFVSTNSKSNLLEKESSC